MWFLGTNDNPGDYRTSGCGACHVVYANDRDPRHSGPYGKFGHTGLTQTEDPTIDKSEEGHPLKHSFTRAIPTAQCMSCHMHQPNMFVNTYLGYTMWDYESDAPAMFPEKQRYPTDEEIREINKNPSILLGNMRLDYAIGLVSLRMDWEARIAKARIFHDSSEIENLTPTLEYARKHKISFVVYLTDHPDAVAAVNTRPYGFTLTRRFSNGDGTLLLYTAQIR